MHHLFKNVANSCANWLLRYHGHIISHEMIRHLFTARDEEARRMVRSAVTQRSHTRRDRCNTEDSLNHILPNEYVRSTRKLGGVEVFCADPSTCFSTATT